MSASAKNRPLIFKPLRSLFSKENPTTENPIAVQGGKYSHLIKDNIFSFEMDANFFCRTTYDFCYHNKYYTLWSCA